MNVKFIDSKAFAGKRYYQFTAIDDCTRYRVPRIYDHNTVKSVSDFVDQIQKVLPFAIKQIQTDNGSEFSSQFSWHLQDLGISHRKAKVRSTEENGKVERSHRTDGKEFYGITCRGHYRITSRKRPWQCRSKVYGKCLGNYKFMCQHVSCLHAKAPYLQTTYSQ